VDAAAWQVYADYLQKLGDPVGDLIALQLAAEQDPVGKTRTPAQRAFTRAFAKHAPRLLGTLIEHGASTADPSAPPMIWKRGVLRRVELGLRPNRESALEVIAPQAKHLAALLPHPAARLLGELSIRCPTQADAAAVIALLVAHRPPLHELELFARADLGDLSELWEALPRLRRVTIGAAFDLGELELPHARRANSCRSPFPMIDARDCPRRGAARASRIGSVATTSATRGDLAPLSGAPKARAHRPQAARRAARRRCARRDGPLAGQLTCSTSGRQLYPHDSPTSPRKERFPPAQIWMQTTRDVGNVEQQLAGVAKHVVTRHVPDALWPARHDRQRVVDRYRDPEDERERSTARSSDRG
jgi:hypothetical protein